jgi:hypothetical protein
MHRDTAIIVLILLMVAVPALVGLLLNLLWSREQVKKELCRQGFAPIQVRWHPFGYWAICHPATFAFQATFVDATGCIQTGRCVVHQWFHTVRWVRDDFAYLDANLSPVWKLLHLAVAGLFGWFAMKLLFSGALWLPTRSGWWVWRGWPVILLALALLCGASNLLAAVAYQYTRQANERSWTLFTRGLGFAGWILFGASIAVALWQAVSK